MNTNNITRNEKLVIQVETCLPQVVEFEFPVVAEGVTPEGYMTRDEFRKSVKSKTYNYYKENGLL